jgi:hypothetical protein
MHTETASFAGENAYREKVIAGIQELCKANGFENAHIELRDDRNSDDMEPDTVYFDVRLDPSLPELTFHAGCDGVGGFTIQGESVFIEEASEGTYINVDEMDERVSKLAFCQQLAKRIQQELQVKFDVEPSAPAWYLQKEGYIDANGNVAEERVGEVRKLVEVVFDQIRKRSVE